MHTSIEHLASCPTCRRRTLHRHVIVLDEAAEVVSDERVCIACADKGQRSKTSALELQRPPRAPGRPEKKRPAKKRPAKNGSEELDEEQAAPDRWRKRGGAA